MRRARRRRSVLRATAAILAIGGARATPGRLLNVETARRGHWFRRLSEFGRLRLHELVVRFRGRFAGAVGCVDSQAGPAATLRACRPLPRTSHFSLLAQREVTKRKCFFAPGVGFVRARGSLHRPRCRSPEHVGACRRCLPSSPSAARWQGLSRFRHDSSCVALEGRQHRGWGSCALAGRYIDRGVARPSTSAAHGRFVSGHCGR